MLYPISELMEVFDGHAMGTHTWLNFKQLFNQCVACPASIYGYI